MRRVPISTTRFSSMTGPSTRCARSRQHRTSMIAPETVDWPGQLGVDRGPGTEAGEAKFANARPFTSERRDTLTIDPVSSRPDSPHTISPDAAKRSTECPHCHEPVTLKQRRVVDDACLY